jgi:hypothetical protein
MFENKLKRFVFRRPRCVKTVIWAPHLTKAIHRLMVLEGRQCDTCGCTLARYSIDIDKCCIDTLKNHYAEYIFLLKEEGIE